MAHAAGVRGKVTSNPSMWRCLCCGAGGGLCCGTRAAGTGRVLTTAYVQELETSLLDGIDLPVRVTAIHVRSLKLEVGGAWL